MLPHDLIRTFSLSLQQKNDQIDIYKTSQALTFLRICQNINYNYKWRHHIFQS